MESFFAFQLYMDFSGLTQATGLVQQAILHAESSHELLFDLLLLISCEEDLNLDYFPVNILTGKNEI